MFSGARSELFLNPDELRCSLIEGGCKKSSHLLVLLSGHVARTQLLWCYRLGQLSPKLRELSGTPSRPKKGKRSKGGAHHSKETTNSEIN